MLDIWMGNFLLRNFTLFDIFWLIHKEQTISNVMNKIELKTKKKGKFENHMNQRKEKKIVL